MSAAASLGASAPPGGQAGPVLVAAKLHVPALRAGLVSRGELVGRLAGAGDCKLVLVCAPAGWGKTSVLSQLHSAEPGAFAWVSLDPGDDNRVRFWSYVIGAVRTVAPQVGVAALAVLPNAAGDLTGAVLPSLLNELAAVGRRLVLVLDNYHCVREESIHASVAFLLRHIPPSVQLAIATRADPPLPLGSLCAAGEVLEIRAAQLRFSDAEARALLNDSPALDLEPAEVALLREQTEGPMNTSLCARYARYTSCGGCGRAPCSNITGVSRSAEMARDTACRSLVSSCREELTNTRRRRSGVGMTASFPRPSLTAHPIRPAPRDTWRIIQPADCPQPGEWRDHDSPSFSRELLVRVSPRDGQTGWAEMMAWPGS
jgi:hypothetical protein